MVYLVYIFSSLLFSAFFSAAETAFVALTSMQAKVLKSRYALRGKIIEFLEYHKPIFISAMVVGNNAANVMFSVASTRYALLIFGEHIVFAATICIILAMLIFGEIPPKQIALQYHMQFLTIFAPLLLVFFIILWPAARCFSFFSAVMGFFFKNKTANLIESISQEHLLHFLYQMRFIKNIPQEKTRRITRALTLSDIPIENIMTHRKDVFSFSADTTVAEAAQKLTKTFYTRVPVYENDDLEHIVGLVHTSHIVGMLLSDGATVQIKTIMSEATVVQESNTAEDVLVVFKHKGTPFVVVIDEYGGLAGVLTNADIASYVLNMQYSASSHSITSVENGAVFRKEQYIVEDSRQKGVFFVRGETLLSEVEDIAHVTLEDRGEAHTIGGYLSEYTGGAYIADEKGLESFKHLKPRKIIEHELLGRFTILEEKNGRIVFLHWKRP